MPAKKQTAPQTVDDTREPVNNPLEAVTGSVPGLPINFTPELLALEASDIIEVWDTSISWRDGHLEHVAAQYKADPARTEAIYHDDVTVARAYSREQWEALIGG